MPPAGLKKQLNVPFTQTDDGDKSQETINQRLSVLVSLSIETTLRHHVLALLITT